jgi:hypothetical protein
MILLGIRKLLSKIHWTLRHARKTTERLDQERQAIRVDYRMPDRIRRTQRQIQEDTGTPDARLVKTLCH